MAKHKAPLGCRIAVLLFGKSTSAIFGRCTLGVKRYRTNCKGCAHNVQETIVENFFIGMREANAEPKTLRDMR